jgi:RNA polymerase sigma-B factor
MKPEPSEQARQERARLRQMLVQYAESRDPTLRDELLTAHLNLARFLAGKFSNRGESLEDLVQVACVGLIKALDRYDPGVGAEFTTYATPTIVGEIKRHFRDRGWAVKVPRRLQELNLAVGRTTDSLTVSLGRVPTPYDVAEALGITPEEVLEARELGQSYSLASLDSELEGEEGGRGSRLLDWLGRHDELIQMVEDRETLRRAFASLSPREQLILYLRFYQNLSQSEIARRVGISQMHVSRLQMRSLEKMKRFLKEGRATPEAQKPRRRARRRQPAPQDPGRKPP